jgi:hypothetical protein
MGKIAEKIDSGSVNKKDVADKEKRYPESIWLK